MRDRFQYYLFGLMMLLVRIHAILRHQYFSRACTRSLICHCSREHSFWNFRVRSLQLLYIWLNDATDATSRNLEIATFSRPRSLSLNCRCSQEHSVMNFRARSLAILFIWPIDATCAISRNSETATFFRALSR